MLLEEQKGLKELETKRQKTARNRKSDKEGEYVTRPCSDEMMSWFQAFKYPSLQLAGFVFGDQWLDLLSGPEIPAYNLYPYHYLDLCSVVSS